MLNIINIEENGDNYWIMLPPRNVITDLEEHIKLDDKNGIKTLNVLYQNLILYNKDINDIYETFKHREYKLYKYDSNIQKIVDYNINYCDIDTCSCYATFEVWGKHYCKDCFDYEEEEEEEEEESSEEGEDESSEENENEEGEEEDESSEENENEEGEEEDESSEENENENEEGEDEEEKLDKS
jgi:hypothetical protein